MSKMKKKEDGYKIVLSSDRTLFSEYQGGIFLGFSACFPTALINEYLYFRFFCPSVEVDSRGSAKLAPRSLRLIQSKLLENGFKKEDIIVAHPDYLNKAIGSKTQVLGLSEQDPLGKGPATSTFTNIFGGEAYMAKKFRELMDNSALKINDPYVILGGAGSWQFNSKEIKERNNIDSVFIGESEKLVCDLFKEVIEKGEAPDNIQGQPADVGDIPKVNEPTLNGFVEISRGCGRGCSFCPLSNVQRRDLSISQIKSDIKINLAAGERTPLLHAEDVLKYRANEEVNQEAVYRLFKEIKEMQDVRFVDVSHFSVSSVTEAPELVEKISDLLSLGENQLFLGGQLGLETGSPRLIKKYMSGKTGSRNPEDWPEMVLEAFKTLSENNWVPAATILMGLPGEEKRDVEKTLELIDKLNEFRSLIVPLSFVSLEEGKSFDIKEAPDYYKRLFKKCWKHNFDWMNSLYKDYSKMYLKGIKSIPVNLILKTAEYYYKNRIEKLLGL